MADTPLNRALGCITHLAVLLAVWIFLGWLWSHAPIFAITLGVVIVLGFIAGLFAG